jgi:hypothetical protein
VVVAPAPWDKAIQIELYVPIQLLRQLMDNGLNAKIGEYCCLVHGWEQFPGLRAAHALFRGLSRPLNESRSDERVFVYVTRPDSTYVYSDRSEPKGWRARPAPHNSVFVTYAEISDELSPVPGEVVPVGVRGVVIGWEWTLAHPIADDLPAEFDTRYVEKVWY